MYSIVWCCLHCFEKCTYFFANIKNDSRNAQNRLSFISSVHFLNFYILATRCGNILNLVRIECWNVKDKNYNKNCIIFWKELVMWQLIICRVLVMLSVNDCGVLSVLCHEYQWCKLCNQHDRVRELWGLSLKTVSSPPRSQLMPKKVRKLSYSLKRRKYTRFHFKIIHAYVLIYILPVRR